MMQLILWTLPFVSAVGPQHPRRLMDLVDEPGAEEAQLPIDPGAVDHMHGGELDHPPITFADLEATLDNLNTEAQNLGNKSYVAGPVFSRLMALRDRFAPTQERLVPTNQRVEQERLELSLLSNLGLVASGVPWYLTSHQTAGLATNGETAMAPYVGKSIAKDVAYSLWHLARGAAYVASYSATMVLSSDYIVAKKLRRVERLRQQVQAAMATMSADVENVLREMEKKKDGAVPKLPQDVAKMIARFAAYDGDELRHLLGETQVEIEGASRHPSPTFFVENLLLRLLRQG